MYGNFVLLGDKGEFETGKRTYLGDIDGRNEAWLRDTLFDHPEILPIDDIDSTFGQLVPLCKELRTEAGAIDAVFINDRGRLTIVECKLWRNPQARREVVAQTLDYVSALSDWSYADLQRQVSAAVGRQGNLPFEAVRKRTKVIEHEFVDAVSRSLREARLLVVLAGDGIREGVQSLTELVNRNSTKARAIEDRRKRCVGYSRVSGPGDRQAKVVSLWIGADPIPWTLEYNPADV